jgi:hypothetical protein
MGHVLSTTYCFHSTRILPAVLYGSKIWSLTLREEHSVVVFESRGLGTMFGAKKDGVTTDWRETHIGELSNIWAVSHQALLR